MSKTYAIADLHGRFDLLEMALACIAERAEPPATLVTLGDYVDRGPDSRKIIERLMAGPGRDGWRLICLKGNHEDIMWQTCRRLPDVDWWLTNGGGATLISYAQHKGDQADVAVVPAAHLDWIEQLPLMHVDAHRVFVHAGIDPNCSLDEQDAEDVIWKLYRDETTAATASATSYMGTISMHMGRSSRRTGPTLIRLRGTPGDLQSASLMTLDPVGQSKFSKSTASRLRRCYRTGGPRTCHHAQRCPLSGVKRTSRFQSAMSAFDPKRTLGFA
jgi:serine/threonine protein phosphatase 1